MITTTISPSVKMTKTQKSILSNIEKNERGTNEITVNNRDGKVLIQVRHYEFSQLSRFDSYLVGKRGNIEKY